MCWNDFDQKIVLYDLHNVFKVFKRLGVKQKYISKKDYIEILRWPFVAFNDIWSNTLFNEIAS